METEYKQSTTELTIDDLKRKMSVTDEQLDTRVEEHDLPELAASFDDAEDYVEKLGLSPTQQVDVRTRKHSNSNEAGVKIALKYWMSQNGVTATFRTLIAILLSLLKGDVAVQVCKYLCRNYPTSTPPSQERVLLNPKLSSYRDYLKSRYGAQVHKSSIQWPPAPTTKVFKLAMIQKEKIQGRKIDDEFVRMTITGKIDDILQLKTPVDIENIFAKNEHSRKFVLIEGAPGSGKSTLALHICQEWAGGKLFQEFDVVILIKLRDPFVREIRTLTDFLTRVNKTIADETEAAMMSTYGKSVLWVLDGWDELPTDLPSDSIINKLVHGQSGTSHECPLHESALIVTSRPSSSAELHPLVSSRVEVLGFTPHELEQFFTECLDGDSQAVQKLLERIRENPVVEGSCYLPLNASIVANCFLYDDHSLPTSNHGIFTSLVQSSLKRYLQEKLGKITPVGDITSSHSLASEIKAPFTQMCQLSYHGIENNKVTFTKEDMVSLSIPNTVSNIGLLQSVSSILSSAHRSYYCFLHLSIQELLAAIHISLMSPKQQICVFQKLFSNPRFSAVFQFYAGITKLRTSRPILRMLPRFLCPVPASIYDLIRKIIKKSEEPLLLSLMHCLYEAEDSSLCEFVVSLLDHRLNLSRTTMNPIDCLAVGYFISISACCTSSEHNKTFGLLLGNCSIGDQGCKFLTRGLTKSHSGSINLMLSLYNNNIKEEGMHYLAPLIKNTDLLTWVNLSRNAIGNQGLRTLCEALSTNASLATLNLDGCSLLLENHGAIPHLLSTNNSLQSLNLSDNKIDNRELRKICEVLTTNTSLKRLNLGYCSLTISPDNGMALAQLLSTNTALEYLSLSGNQLTSCYHIAAGLAANNTLRILRLINCGLTDTSMEELVTGLGKIEELHIWDNYSLTMNGMKTLAQQVAINPNLKLLWIPDHLHSCIEIVFREANEERKRYRLPKIDVRHI